MSGAPQDQGQVSAGIFPGWLVVAGAFGVMCVGFGAAYTFGTVFSALQGEFQVSRGAASVVFSVAGFLYFALGGVSGPIADRFEARAVCLAGMLTVALGLFLAARAQSLEAIYVAYGLGIGIGIGLAYTPAIGAVQPWFGRRRGFASGLAVSGIGVGTLLGPPIAGALIDGLGWRDAYTVLAAAVALLGGGAALLVRGPPQRYGLTAEPGGGAPAAGLTLREAMRTRTFRLIYVATLLGAFGVFMPFVHLVPYAEDKGIARPEAVLLLSLIGVGSTAGRFLLGGLADRFGRRASLAAMFLGMGVSLATWPLGASTLALGAFALVFGTFYGGFVALLPAFVADRFGGRNASSIIGALYTSVAFGTLLGPSLAGYAFDLAGSYVLPVALSAAGSIGSGIAVWTVRDEA